MEVLFYYLGESPTNIYDTQIANALLSDHNQIGYAALVENELGKQLDKSQTRTNWLQRPLTEKQIQYAGDDVLYLYQLHRILDEKLEQLNRKDWFEEDCTRLFNNTSDYQVAIDKLWKRVKGTTRLDRQKLMLVQSIAIWREQLAQQKDRTRRKILSDDMVIELALKTPTNNQELDQITGRRYNFNEPEQQALLDAIDTALQTPEQQWPDNRYNGLDGQQKTLLKNLQQLVNKKAEQLNIASAAICSKRDLEALIQHQDKQTCELTLLQGWRLQNIGKQLLSALE